MKEKPSEALQTFSTFHSIVPLFAGGSKSKEGRDLGKEITNQVTAFSSSACYLSSQVQTE